MIVIPGVGILLAGVFFVWSAIGLARTANGPQTEIRKYKNRAIAAISVAAAFVMCAFVLRVLGLN